MHGRAYPRIVPIEKSPSFAALVHVPAYAIEHHSALRSRVKLGTPEVGRTGLQDVFPDPEDFVHSVEGVHFEFVVGVFAGDEDFQAVANTDIRMALLQVVPDDG